MNLTIDYSNIFWILAVALLVIGLFSKVLWLFYAASILWVVSGIFYIVNGTDTFMQGLGWVFIAFGIGSAFTPVVLRQKKQEEIIPTKSRIEYLTEHRNKIKAIRDGRIKRTDDD